MSPGWTTPLLAVELDRDGVELVAAELRDGPGAAPPELAEASWGITKPAVSSRATTRAERSVTTWALTRRLTFDRSILLRVGPTR
jgi:hypothetical protein